MKLKSLLLGLTAAALTGASSHAATVIYVTGSTAYRAPAIAAILAYLNSNTVGNVVNGTIKSPNSPPAASDLFGASTGVYENSDASIIIETAFGGSAGGLVDLVTASTEKYIDTTNAAVVPSQIVVSNLVGPNNGGGTQSYGQALSSPPTVTHVPLVSFSDTFYNTVASTLNNALIYPTTGLPNPNGAAITKGPQFAQYFTSTNIGYAGTVSLAGAQDAVGIVPFAWYLGNSSSPLQASFQTAITNVTQQTAASLIAGPTPIKLFSGSTSLTGSVYLIGRNEDSGTRVEAFAEAQKGFTPSANQWELDFSSGGTNTTGTLTLANKYTASPNNETQSQYNTYDSANFTTSLPTGGLYHGSDAVVSAAYNFEHDEALYTQPYVYWNTYGHSGYAGGADVANVLLSDNANPDTITGGNLPNPSTGDVVFVGYLGWADGYNLLYPPTPTGYSSYTSSAKQLNYNGVAPTVANVQNGSYTMWGFEHMYYMQAGSGANVLASSDSRLGIINSIADSVYSTYAATNNLGVTKATMDQVPTTAGILFNTVNVTRTQEGYPVQTK